METTEKKLPFSFKEAVILTVSTLLIICLVFFAGLKYQKKTDTVTEQYLRNQIEQYQKEADQWKGKYEASLEEKNTLVLSIDSLESEITKLKKNYGQKVTVIKSYTNPELERFFADRYGN